jgi:hypothetical protein
VFVLDRCDAWFVVRCLFVLRIGRLPIRRPKLLQAHPPSHSRVTSFDVNGNKCKSPDVDPAPFFEPLVRTFLLGVASGGLLEVYTTLYRVRWSDGYNDVGSIT